MTTTNLTSDEREPTIRTGGECLSIFEIMQRYRNDGSCGHVIEDALRRLSMNGVLVRREDAARAAELINDSVKAKGKFAAAILMMPPYPAPDCPICGYAVDSTGLCVLDATHTTTAITVSYYNEDGSYNLAGKNIADHAATLPPLPLNLGDDVQRGRNAAFYIFDAAGNKAGEVYDRGFGRWLVTRANAVAKNDVISRSDVLRILHDARASGGFDLRELIAEVEGLVPTASPSTSAAIRAAAEEIKRPPSKQFSVRFLDHIQGSNCAEFECGNCKRRFVSAGNLECPHCHGNETGSHVTEADAIYNQAVDDTVAILSRWFGKRETEQEFGDSLVAAVNAIKSIPEDRRATALAMLNNYFAAPAAPSPGEPPSNKDAYQIGILDACKAMCGYCADAHSWGDAVRVEGSTRFWHTKQNPYEYPCEATSIRVTLAAALRTSVEERNAAEMSDADQIAGKWAPRIDEMVSDLVPAEPPKCTWKYDLDGYWQTSCGDQFCFTEGGPTENRVRFCHYCGKEVFESVYANGSGEGESE